MNILLQSGQPIAGWSVQRNGVDGSRGAAGVEVVEVSQHVPEPLREPEGLETLFPEGAGGLPEAVSAGDQRVEAGAVRGDILQQVDVLRAGDDHQ